MCGIVGLVDLKGIDRDCVERGVAAALSRMANRGPDAEGRWFGPTCALGHRRLAVLDLTAEAGQPMHLGQYVLIFNGEIYNFARLRKELEELGHHFRTRSDTEVILAGWKQWGAQLLPRLEGMFALAIWDSASETLVLARDRMGKKPLFYAQHSDGAICFASDLRAVEDVCGRRWALDESALRLYFALRWIPEPRTILSGVHKLPPGHFLRFAKSTVEVRQWAPTAASRPSFSSQRDAAEELLSCLDAAVRDRMVADVPIGIFLSGGLDSAAIAASAAALGVRPNTYTVRFPGAGDLDEGPAAAVVAKHLDSEHHEIHLTGKDVREGLFAALDGLDEPFADASALPTYMLCRAVRGQVTVILSGDGGDEVFGGYRRYVAERLMAVWDALPRSMRKVVAEPLLKAVAAGAPSAETARRIRRFLEQIDTDWGSRQIGWLRQCENSEMESLFVAKIPYPDLRGLLVAARPDDRDPITATLRTDQAFSLVGQMLVKVDRMSMAASVEVRSPFLDSRVVAAANAMPGAWKVGLRRGKLILRRALAQRLPAEVFALAKRGFDPPLAQWLAGDLSELVRWASDPGRVASQGLFRAETVLRWRQRLELGDVQAARKIWTLVCFQRWAAKRGLYPA